jgi:DNA (cytosine-5)-methyltransferase 1
MDGQTYVPQHRERIMIVGFDKDIFEAGKNLSFQSRKKPRQSYQTYWRKMLMIKYTLSDHLWKYLQDYAKKQKNKGNGFGYGLANLDGISRTLSARYYKDGSEILSLKEETRTRENLRQGNVPASWDIQTTIVWTKFQIYRHTVNAEFCRCSAHRCCL